MRAGITRDRAILLDLDGTLLTIEQRFFHVFNDTLKQFGLKRVPLNRFLYLFHSDRLGDVLSELGGAEGKDTDGFWLRFLRDYGAARYRKYSRVVPHAHQTLRRLRESRVRIGLLTGRLTSRRTLVGELSEYGLFGLVDAVVTKADVLSKIRDRSIISRDQEILEAARRLRTPPEMCFFVGDYVEDVRSARRVGATPVAMLRGSSRPQILEHERPAMMIRSIAQLPKIFELRQETHTRGKTRRPLEYPRTRPW